MFSIFRRSKRVLGLDITTSYIRYVEVLKRGERTNLVSYGEERVPSVEPRNALLSTIREIKRKTKTRDAVVSLPEDIVRFEIIDIHNTKESDILKKIEFRLTEERLLSYEESVLYFEKLEILNDRVFYKVLVSSRENVDFFKSIFVNSGINVLKFMSHNDALESSCVKSGTLLPAIVLNMAEQFTNIAVYYPFNQTREINLKIPKEHISEAVKEVYLDFYKENNEKIGYIFASGIHARDVNFLNYLSRETRLPIEEANVFVNIEQRKNDVPLITKEESFLYAIALGLAIG